MGLNRMMMKNGEDLKNIKAMMTVGEGSFSFGFVNESAGSLSPNPLPNGVLVTHCHCVLDRFKVNPASIKSCTINNITVVDGKDNAAAASYLKQNVGKTIPVIFHFD